MTQAVCDILGRALTLSRQERAELASKLIKSLDGPPPTPEEQAAIDAAWGRRSPDESRRSKTGRRAHRRRSGIRVGPVEVGGHAKETGQVNWRFHGKAQKELHNVAGHARS